MSGTTVSLFFLNHPPLSNSPCMLFRRKLSVLENIFKFCILYNIDNLQYSNSKRKTSIPYEDFFCKLIII